MADIFFIGDTHFGHEKTCTVFKRKDGCTPLRPFANAQEMDEEMIKRWNSVVKQDSKVYHLGDVVINLKHLSVMERLNGNKRLIRGNHDIAKTSDYLKYFKHIYGVRVLDDMVLSHVPLHPASITQRWGVNVHGHYHANIVERLVTKSSDLGSIEEYDVLEPDPLYFNVSVEQIDYTPIELSELRSRIKANREKYGDVVHGEYTHRK